MRQNSLGAYVKSIEEIKPLTKEQEQTATKEKLILHNLMFVVKTAHAYKTLISMEELVQAGNYGLILAAEKFDTNKKVKFISYAVWYIKKYMRQAINGQLCLTKGGVNKEGKCVAEFYSFDAPLDSSKKGSKSGKETESISSWYDIKPDEAYGANVFEASAADDDKRILMEYINELSEIEKNIISRRYGIGFDSKLTLKQTALDLNLPISLVDMTERKAMVKLREKFGLVA